MSFFKNLFKGNKEQEVKKEQIVPLTNGELVNISQVPDEVFSSKMMGDGFAMKTSDGIIVSPVEGTIVTVFPTKHAFGIKSGDVEILIHVGLETVAMKGEGFDVAVSAGDRVEVGQTLLTYDLELVKEKAKDIITPCVITNMDAVANIEVLKLNETVDFSQEVAKVKLK